MNKNLKVVLTSVVITIIGVIILSVFVSLVKISNSVVVNTLLESTIVFAQFLILKRYEAGKSFVKIVGLEPNKHRLKLSSIGFLIGAVYTFVVFGGLAVMNYLDYQGIGFQLYSSSSVMISVFNAFTTAIFAGVCEEIFFRGVILNYLSKYKGNIFALIISSLIFSVAHFSRTSDIRYFAVIFTLGLVFGVCFLKTKSLYLSMGIHFAVDFCAYLIAMDEAGLFVFKLADGVTMTSIDVPYTTLQLAAAVVFAIIFGTIYKIKRCMK